MPRMLFGSEGRWFRWLLLSVEKSRCCIEDGDLEWRRRIVVVTCKGNREVVCLTRRKDAAEFRDNDVVPVVLGKVQRSTLVANANTDFGAIATQGMKKGVWPHFPSSRSLFAWLCAKSLVDYGSAMMNIYKEV